MNYLRNCKGFTLIELLIILVIVCIVLCLIPTVMSNIFWTEAGVMKQLKDEHPSITTLRSSQRNHLSYSRITVEENGKRATYLLDSNILFNYTFHNE